MDFKGQQIYFKSSASMDELEDDSVQLVVTSPPYWNVKDYGDASQLGFGQSYKEYIKSLNDVWLECIRVMKPNGKIGINFQPLPISSENSGYGRRIIKNIMFDVEQFMRENDLYLSGMHYWDKAPFINTVSWGSYPKPTNIYSNTSFEQVFVFVKPGETRKVDKEVLDVNLLDKEEWRHWAVRCIWDDISPVIKINSKGENILGHVAPFPEDIPYRLIKMHTVKGETVLDPFLGSGTTLKMTRLTNRKGVGYEINESYEQMIKDKIREDWNPPPIESHYKSVGNETMARILEKLYIHAIENGLALEKDKFFSGALKQLKNDFPELFSDAFIKNVKKHLA
ncbi:MAG: DNA-methyltransferase [Candidatus Hodarchaeota archaeon]